MFRLACVALTALALPASAQTALAPPAAPKATKPAKPPSEPPAAQEARLAVSRPLKDPLAAQFQNVRQKIVQNRKGQPMPVVCGDVNAKNSYGAYVGFAPWIYLVDLKMAFVLGPDRDIATIAMLKDYCS